MILKFDKSIHFLLLVLIISLSSCEEANQAGINIPGVTNGSNTLPTGEEFSRLVNDSVNPPGGNCNYAQRDEAIPAVAPSSAAASNVCKHFSKFKRSGVPEAPLKQALKFYEKNKSKFKSSWVSIADYSQKSDKKRFYMVNLESGEVRKHKVSHGSGNRGGRKYGDENHDGMIDRCQHPGSSSRTNMTRPGFFATGEQYYSCGSKKNGRCSHAESRNSRGLLTKGWPKFRNGKNALRLDGLTPSVNNGARGNGVVMHGAWYNEPDVTGQQIMGRSYGCPAFDPDEAESIIGTITDKSLYYSYVPTCANDMNKSLAQVAGWQNQCN